MLSTRDHFRPRDTYRLRVRGWKKIFHTNGNQKKAGVAILIIKKSIQEEDIKIINIYAPKIHKANANNHKRGNQQ